jgi:5-formyltetrahydrofolate cyclo-ligase
MPKIYCKSIRKEMLQQRSLLKPKQCDHASSIIAQHLARTPVFLRSKRIAFYFANNNEVDPQSLFFKAIKMGKNCFIPVLHPVKHNQLWFAPYRPGDCLIKNNYGILEPDLTSAKIIPAWTLDLVITPLVAFDTLCHRLGMGGGYYDRTFAFTLQHKHHKPSLIGLAYEFQKVSQLATNTWDVPLNWVITEQSIYRSEKKNL